MLYPRTEIYSPLLFSCRSPLHSETREKIRMIVFKFPDARGSGSPPMQMRAADPVLASGNGRVPCAWKQSPRLAVAASCHFEVTPIFPALVCWRWSHAPARSAISSSPAACVSRWARPRQHGGVWPCLCWSSGSNFKSNAPPHCPLLI